MKHVLTPRIWASLGLLLIGAAPAAAAPVWESRPVLAIGEADGSQGTGWDGFDAQPWVKAAAIDRFSNSAVPETDAMRTQVKMALSRGTLWIYLRCHEQEKPAPGESIELWMACRKDRDVPMIHVEIAADGTCVATREPTASALPGPLVNERIEAGIVKSDTGRTADGWWAKIALPLEKLGVEPGDLRLNIMRYRGEGKAYSAWCDLWNGRLRNVARLGRVTFGAAPDADPPRIDLPAELAVGTNKLHLAAWNDGLVLKVHGKTIPVDASGDASVEISDIGPAELSLQNAKGEELRGYTCDVRRPLIIEAVAPFGGEVAGPVAADVTLEIPKGAELPLQVTALQNNVQIGRVAVKLTAGTHRVSIPIENARPGEILLRAAAAGGELPGDARRWCLLGQSLADVDKYRDGIEKLQGAALIRASVCDAANVWRLKQKGDGTFTAMKGATLWPQEMTYLMAVVYKTKWPENPYVGDDRFLHAAIAGMDAALDPARRETWRNAPDNRSLQAFLMTCELLKNDIPPETETRWRSALSECVESVVRSWVGPIGSRLSRYSDDIGTSTNHWSLHAANVYTAGRIFNRKDWLDLGAQEMHALARHEQNGIFPERRNVPTPSYNWLTATALAEYFLQSGDQQVAPAFNRCADFAWKMSLAGGEQPMLFDGRVNGHTSAAGFPMMYAFTPEGRYLLRDCWQRFLRPRTPGRWSPEAWHRWCELALAMPANAESERPPEDGEFSFMDGLALSVRRHQFCYALSGLCDDEAMKGLFRLDAQNAVELYHDRAGAILQGDNSQDQPEAGIFFRKIGDKTTWLPVKAQITRLDDGHNVRLIFDNFTASVTVRILSENQAEVRAEILEAKGDDPVTFNVFPAGPTKLSDDGKTLQLEKSRIVSSLPLKLQTDLKLYNPYSGKYEMRVKPNRAWADMKKGDAIVLKVEVTSGAR